jgi:hypothetical protein
MDCFGPRCKGLGVRCGDLGVDDAFSAHRGRPLTGVGRGEKLAAFL